MDCERLDPRKYTLLSSKAEGSERRREKACKLIPKHKMLLKYYKIRSEVAYCS